MIESVHVIIMVESCLVLRYMYAIIKTIMTIMIRSIDRTNCPFNSENVYLKFSLFYNTLYMCLFLRN